LLLLFQLFQGFSHFIDNKRINRRGGGKTQARLKPHLPNEHNSSMVLEKTPDHRSKIQCNSNQGSSNISTLHDILHALHVNFTVKPKLYIICMRCIFYFYFLKMSVTNQQV